MSVLVAIGLSASCSDDLDGIDPTETDDGGSPALISPPVVKPVDAGGHMMTDPKPRDAGLADVLVPPLLPNDAKVVEVADTGVADADVPDAGPVDTFAPMFALLTESCVGCHGAGKLLDVSTPALAYASLINVPAAYKACIASDGGVPLLRVVPGNLEQSLLIQKLENHQTCGKQMPLTMLLPETSVAVFRAWVSAGAPAP